MKIELSQSGGYAGETIKLKEISSEHISAANKEKLNALLNETDFFNLAENELKKDIGADLLTYHLKISKSKNESHKVSFGDSVSNSSLSKLLTLIKSL